MSKNIFILTHSDGNQHLASQHDLVVYDKLSAGEDARATRTQPRLKVLFEVEDAVEAL